MSIDAGSVQASLYLEVSNFTAGIASARTQLQTFSEAAGAIDGSLAALQQTMNNSYQLIGRSAATATKTMTDENIKAVAQMKIALSEMTGATEQLLVTFQNNVSSKMAATAGSMVIAGGNMGDGLVAGLLSRLSAATSAGAALANAAEKGAKSAAQIQSPSKVFMEIGRYMDEGLAEGIRENKYLARDEMSLVANAILQTGNEISTGILSLDKSTGAAIIDSTYRALMTKAELYITERDQRILNITEGTEESIRQIERETRATEDSYNIKIKLYEQEMYARLSLIDDSSNEEIADLRKQLEDINKLNEDDRKKDAEERFNEQLADKQKALLKAITLEDYDKIAEQIAVLRRNREKALLQEERKEEQEALRDKISEIQQKASADKEALREEFEAKKYQLQLKQEAEMAYLKEMQKRLQEDSKTRKELEEVQTKLKLAEGKKRSQAEVTELKLREQELLRSLENNKLSLEAFTAKVETIGKGYGEKLVAGFRSTEGEIVEYLEWIVKEAEEAGRAVADARDSERDSDNESWRSVSNATYSLNGQSDDFSSRGNLMTPRSGFKDISMANFQGKKSLNILASEQKQKTLELNIDYDKLALAISKNIPRAISMENHFTSPKALSETEIRKNQEMLLRDLAFRV